MRCRSSSAAMAPSIPRALSALTTTTTTTTSKLFTARPVGRSVCTMRRQSHSDENISGAASISSSTSQADLSDTEGAASTAALPVMEPVNPHSHLSCITYRGKQFSVARGTKLRTAMLLNGVSPHNGRAQIINCRGLGTCGTCAVEIRGTVLPDSWTTAEQLRLNFPPHKAPNNLRLRLACQVSCEGGELEVIKRDKFWGQGDTVLGPAGAEDYSLPFGELEFLLDSTRRKL